MNRRIAGRVKHAQKRAKVRADIRAGRRISMQAYVNGTAEHNHAPVAVAEMPEDEAMPVPGDPNGTHQVIAKDNGTVMGQGTESQMRKLRAECMREMPDTAFSVRKVK